jgi:glycosyltransferase involved in cell wall biosynthesis
LGIPELARVIGSVGRLTEVKNQTLLIRAAAPLLGHTVRLILVGDGEVREMLQQIALETGRAEFIYFVGHQKHVGRWLAAFDVFALSSNSEGLPLVIPEAMATGCPILSTAVGGIPEVVAEGETGFLVAPGDVAAFSTKLAEMIQEAERSAEWGKRAREVALERYSANRMLDAYMACYRRAIRSQ